MSLHPIVGRYAPMPSPTLRQMPRHWQLEGANNIKPPHTVRRLLVIAFWLALLLAYVSAVKAVLA